MAAELAADRVAEAPEAATLHTLGEGDPCWACARSTWPVKTRRFVSGL
jgi:hypothetical protein